MKHNYIKAFVFFCLSCMALMGYAQGLEGVEVELYYESPTANGTLPAGSKTYRVYVNMLPGYTLQAVYGDLTNELKFESTTNFFNDADNGGNFANDVVNGVLASGPALVDSWFSFGSGGGTRKGTLKVNDTDGGISGTPLTNSGGAMGSPLTTHDGRSITTTALVPASAGADLTSPPYDAFNNAIVSNIFTSIATPGGFSYFSTAGAATGAGTDNRVLIGQFTTTGAFGYRLNLQLGTPTPGVSENYTANTAAPALGLVLEPNLGNPTVSIPGGNITQPVGTVVTITATASDVAPGTITKVEFFNGATKIGEDLTSPYTQSFTVGASPATITAVATDNQGATATSNAITVGAAPNVPPTVSLGAAPLTVVVGDNITLTATAADSDGTIADVKFYSGTPGSGTLLNTDATAPYDFAATTTTTGTISYYAVATDNSGASTTSNIANAVVNANQLPVVTITAPANATDVFVPAVVSFTSNATDADGTITNVEFLVNGVVVGSDNTAPYSYDWTSAATGGFVNFVTRATDNKGGVTTSAPRTIRARLNTGTKYEVKEVNELCNADNICVPISAKSSISEIIGFDLEIKYPKNKLIPTGIIRKYGDLAPLNLFETSSNVLNTTSTTNGKMLVAVYFNTTAPATQRFTGIGDLVCIEFEKRPTFQANDSVFVVVTKLQESYITGPEIETVDSNKYKTFKQTSLAANLEFWADRSPIAYVSGVNLITNIYGNNTSCNSKSSVAVQPDLNGEFVHDLNNGLTLNIERDILGNLATPGTDVQSVINGFDALLVRKVLIEDLSFIPNIYQALAMDVNMDGVISAGDASQINQRAVLQINEFRQKWNYNNNGTKKPGKGNSKDWIFLDETTLLDGNNVEYAISANYPRWDSRGFNKDHVPVPDSCRTTPVSNWTGCSVVGTDTYIGVLLGDVNGNYKNISSSATLRSNEAVSIDFSLSKTEGNTITVPVFVNSSADVYSVDFSMNINMEGIEILSIAGGEQSLFYFNENDNTLRFTSNSIQKFNQNLPVALITLETKDEISQRDIHAVAAYINGDEVDFNVLNSVLSTDETLSGIQVYPNPTTGQINIISNIEATASLFDLSGKKVLNLGKINLNQNSFDFSNVMNGIYKLVLTSGDKSEVKKIIITK